MQISLTTDGVSCVLKSVDNASSNAFTVPATAEAIKSAIVALLSDPEAREMPNDQFRLERMRDGIRVHAGMGAFMVPYAHVFPLVA